MVQETPAGQTVGLAFIGCGYVADFYAATLPNHEQLHLVGVWDRDTARSTAFAKEWDCRVFGSYDDVLADPRVDIVVNLTNPASHFEVSRAALEAGKHVYSEKPFALDMADAEALVELAEDRGLLLSSAPCTLLGETAQTLWSALRKGVIGQPRLVYAELDDGMVHRMPHREWYSASGAPWPAADEFAVGCTLEHSGYVLTWLTAFFGPVRRVVTYAAELLPDKGVGETFHTPDFSCGVLEFHSGVVARVTNSIVGPRDHSVRIIGDEGVLSIADTFRFGEPVLLSKAHPPAMESGRIGYLGEFTEYPLVRPADFPHRYTDTHDIEFCRGIADMAEQLRGRGPGHLNARHALHVLELTLRLSGGDGAAGVHDIRTTFPAPAPMPWSNPGGAGDE
ncbi:Gfo/Idh/MocA family oxidoreductase [Streptomyces pactum]|uniref:Gfo/Idh/MocA family oxidoreductase n=1 Tax=Streptomyces pactum TaxID=68249 RepID=A0ABS0NLD9_9ACTN|nr:Gfo/Idh/MocA family oxidoreductase [Streptomyces pactum]MBH5335912.1 Gfo/Idh/MocA family oxidoreductase [Streptomyces pactum]